MPRTTKARAKNTLLPKKKPTQKKPKMKKMRKTARQMRPLVSNTGPTSKLVKSSMPQASRALEIFGGLSPLTQHELTSERPGCINTPFVEYNGEVSRIPTTIANGQFQLVTSGVALTKYSIVTVCPIFGLTTNPISTGISYVDNLLDSAFLSNLNLQGLAFTDVYGSTTFASKILAYASTVEISFLAPEATINGVVYIGSLPYSSFYQSTISTLIDGASTTIDLKKQTTWELRSCVSNRQLIHNDPGVPVSTMKEESISYAIISEQPVTSIASDTAITYTVSLKPKSNVLWWPVNSSPVLNGIATKPAESVAVTTPGQERFCHEASNAIAAPQPSTLKQILNAASKLASGMDFVPGLSAFSAPTKALISAVSSFAIDPLTLLPSISEIISDLNWFLTAASNRWPQITNPEIDFLLTNWFNTTNETITSLREIDYLVKDIKRAASRYQKVLKQDRGSARYAYLDETETEVVIETDLSKWLKKKRQPSKDKENKKDESSMDLFRVV